MAKDRTYQEQIGKCIAGCWDTDMESSVLQSEQGRVEKEPKAGIMGSVNQSFASVEDSCIRLTQNHPIN